MEWELHRLNVTLGPHKNASLLAFAYINLCLFTSLLFCGSSVLVTFTGAALSVQLAMIHRNWKATGEALSQTADKCKNLYCTCIALLP